ncbi:MAG: IS30 family transposase [Flavonifractor plautii]
MNEGWLQAALAEKTGVNIRAIQRYESGERKIEGASLTVALRIADAWASTRANLFEHTHEGPTLAITARAGPFSCYKGEIHMAKRRRFRHLSWNDRLRIEAFLKCGKSVQEIADEIGVHRNTIYNELKRGRYTHRNSDWTEEERYSPDIAEAAYREHLAAKGPDLKIGKDYRLAEYIERRIVEDGYSPAAVLGEIKVKGIQFNTTICEATLYSYIKKGVFLTLEMVHLPCKGKQKRPYTKVKKNKKAARASAGKSIEKRDPEIDTREEVGHWEMDCVEGKKKTKETLLVLSERKARKEIMIKMKDQTAGSVVAALDRLERRYGTLFYKIFQTITVDNGSEFADVEGLERSQCRRKGKAMTSLSPPVFFRSVNAAQMRT